MYFLVFSNKLDRDLMTEYSRSLPNSELILLRDNIGVYLTDEVARGSRGDVYEVSKEYECSHLFFDGTLKHFHDHKLLVSDMDSTLISIECVDVLAAYHGCADEVSKLTAEAMAGRELDYRTSLLRRVRLLAGLAEESLPHIYDQHIRLNPGADELLKQAHASGMYTTIVSGGFTYFTERLRKQLGMSAQVGNELELRDGVLTGEVLGDLVDGEYKAASLRQLRGELGLEREEVIALGDGANDLPMMEAAGLAVGYRPKKIVGQYADAVLFNGLDELPHMIRIGKEAIEWFAA